MAETPQPPTHPTAQTPVPLPRLTITYCTQCRWLLRAAWLQQELLTTFSTTLGEIALIPSTGGIFRIHLLYIPSVDAQGQSEGAREVLIWDRKAEGGFPEPKVLKQRVRDCVEPGRGLGHSDVGGKKKGEGPGEGKEGDVVEGKGGEEGKEGGAPDLAGSVRAEGPKNPLVGRMRPEVGGKGEEAKTRGEECEDCR